MLYNSDNSNEATRRAIVGEFTFQVVTAAQSTIERQGDLGLVNVNNAEWNMFKANVNFRRDQLALPPLP